MRRERNAQRSRSEVFNCDLDDWFISDLIIAAIERNQSGAELGIVGSRIWAIEDIIEARSSARFTRLSSRGGNRNSVRALILVKSVNPISWAWELLVRRTVAAKARMTNGKGLCRILAPSPQSCKVDYS